jgi:RNAse (barnase) inhibitor barstar
VNPSNLPEIVLAGAQWTTQEDFYNTLLPLLGAPDWHGHNLDALWDSIVTGHINQVNPPFKVRITGVDVMSANCKKLVDRFVELVSEAKAEGIAVDVVCE